MKRGCGKNAQHKNIRSWACRPRWYSATVLYTRGPKLKIIDISLYHHRHIYSRQRTPSSPLASSWCSGYTVKKSHPSQPSAGILPPWGGKNPASVTENIVRRPQGFFACLYAGKKVNPFPAHGAYIFPAHRIPIIAFVFFLPEKPGRPFTTLHIVYYIYINAFLE